jgi:vacuolar-type H+-ATPase subunit B/Vma2
MSSYADALRGECCWECQVVGIYPGYMYTDLSTIFMNSGRIEVGEMDKVLNYPHLVCQMMVTYPTVTISFNYNQ